MNKWPRHKPKTEARLAIEFRRCKNPVTISVLRIILFNRSLETRNCFHRIK